MFEIRDVQGCLLEKQAMIWMKTQKACLALKEAVLLKEGNVCVFLYNGEAHHNILVLLHDHPDLVQNVDAEMFFHFGLDKGQDLKWFDCLY